MVIVMSHHMMVDGLDKVVVKELQCFLHINNDTQQIFKRLQNHVTIHWYSHNIIGMIMHCAYTYTAVK